MAKKKSKARPKPKSAAKAARAVKVPKQILYAEPAGFPGIRIPLVNEEVRIAMGLPEARLPPKESWTEDQRRALDELARILVPAAMFEAVKLMGDVVLPEGQESDLAALERYAAGEALKTVKKRSWKPAGTFEVPKSMVEELLNRIAAGSLSLLAGPMQKARKKARKRPR